MLREGLFDHHRRDNLALLAAGATPIATAYLGPVPEGYCWYIENLAWSVLGNSHTALADFAVTPDNGNPPSQASWDHAGLFDVFTAAVRGARNYAGAIQIPSGHFLLCYFAGGTLAAGDAATVGVQTAVHQLDPGLGLMSPEDRKQVYAAHEHAAAGLNETAVAARRAV